MFEVHIIIYGQSAHFGGRFDTACHLLSYMPCLVGQMLLLAGSDMDVRPLCIGQCLYGCRFVRIVMHTHIVHREAGQVFDARFQIIGHTCLVLLLYRLLEFPLQGFIIVFFTLYGLHEFSLQRFVFFVIKPLYRLFELAL